MVNNLPPPALDLMLVEVVPAGTVSHGGKVGVHHHHTPGGIQTIIDREKIIYL